LKEKGRIYDDDFREDADTKAFVIWVNVNGKKVDIDDEKDNGDNDNADQQESIHC